MFTDMAASSMFAEMFGARAALKKRKRHNQLLVPIIARHRGILVEAFGDSLLAVFDQPDDAARCAISMQRKLTNYNETHPVEYPELEIHVRVGLHTGRLILCRYDGQLEVAGQAVNVAARVEAGDHRKTDQILASEKTWNLLKPDRRFQFEPLPVLQARGIGDLALYRLKWRCSEQPERKFLTLSDEHRSA
ncbi:MAG: hypothetical protein Tsb009_12610 [Planctomycetaceae bacterium]